MPVDLDLQCTQIQFRKLVNAKAHWPNTWRFVDAECCHVLDIKLIEGLSLLESKHDGCRLLRKEGSLLCLVPPGTST